MTSAQTSSDSSKEKTVDGSFNPQEVSNDNVKMETEQILELQEETTFITGLPLALTLASTGLAMFLISLVSLSSKRQ
jgi:hypothetical protein